MEFKEILNGMLEEVQKKYSKKQDSPIYNSLAPVAYMLAKIYKEIIKKAESKFVDKAVGEDLDRLANEIGLNRFLATPSVYKVEFLNKDGTRIDVPINFRISIDDFIFKTVKRFEKGVFLIESEISGQNTSFLKFEKVFTIDNFSEIAEIREIELIEKGENTETDESLRVRFYVRIREPATSGNVYHYKRWAMEIGGVGKAKVFPLWNGNGTVKVLVINSDMEVADSALIQKVSRYIEENRPIGATVTVESAKVKDISVNATISIVQGADLESIKNNFQMALKEYFKSISFDENISYISYAKVGNILLETKDVLDYNNLRINGTTSNVSLLSSEIPKLSISTLGV